MAQVQEVSSLPYKAPRFSLKKIPLINTYINYVNEWEVR